MKKIKILDIGCGRGAKIPFLQKKGIVTGIDITPEFIATCKQLYPNEKFLVMDALNISLASHSFDEVYCMDVIEHVNNPNLLLKNINKVLKRNGKLFLDIPYYNSEKLLSTFNPTYASQVHHQTVFSFKKIVKLLNKNDFMITSCQKTKFFDNMYLLFYFLNGKKILNQQGEFIQDSEVEKLISFLVQYVYLDNSSNPIIKSELYSHYNDISKKYFNISLIELLKFCQFSDKLVSPFFPKTISLECCLKKNALNTLSMIDVKNKYINLSKYSTNELTNEYQDSIKELTEIKNSKFYKLWPIYQHFKNIFKHEK